MKCKRCQDKAVIQLRQHNAAFCHPCFIGYFRRQVQRAIEQQKMFTRDDRVLIAVSGGKDSLALWEVLAELGYTAVGLHIDLGIGDYSSESSEITERFAHDRGLRLITVRLDRETESIPAVAQFTNRPACSACGTSKRYYFDRTAREHGFSVLATGHNLDDEASRLLGNIMHWQVEHLAKQHPVLAPTHDQFVRKVKPLYRISEYETAVYAFLQKLDYIVDECPNSKGATQLIYKEALNRIEAGMPGSKLNFLQEFLRSGQPHFRQEAVSPPNTCEICGMPAFGVTCSYCRLKREAAEKRTRHTGTTAKDRQTDIP